MSQKDQSLKKLLRRGLRVEIEEAPVGIYWVTVKGPSTNENTKAPSIGTACAYLCRKLGI